MTNKIIKNRGRYYTPKNLADFLASLTITSSNSTILDPAFGNGALLLASFNRLKENGAINASEQLFGYDIFPLCKKHQKKYYAGILKENNLSITDFFSVSPETRKKFSQIVMNPPFIRHHKIEWNQYERIQSTLIHSEKILKSSDMWVYFILHSLNFLEKGGSLAAILPWSFIQADYSRALRECLIDKFESIDVIVLGKHFFENAQERILILHAKKFNCSTKKISLGYSYEIPQNVDFLIDIDKQNWLSSPWKELGSIKYSKLLRMLEPQIKFRPLGHYGEIKIGTVTGANAFFVVDSKAIQENRIPRTVLKPIITNAKELKTLSIDSINDWDRFLLVIPEKMKIDGKFLKYIQFGEKLRYNTRYHTKNRETWFSIPNPKKPDGFFQYMTKGIPHIVFNQSDVLSTNSVHQIFFNKDLDKTTKKWIQFSMFSSISQLSIELYSKTYGGGILKIEPSAAKKILVYDGKDQPYPKKIERKINKLLAEGNRDEIVDLVDEWFVQFFGLSDSIINQIKDDFQLIRNIRER
jgi:adenine-specific DNA methylase